MKKKGFTLIELLVVIAIIALLMAILMPSLNKVKEAARSTLCKTNQHSLAMSYIAYSDENDSQLPGSFNHYTLFPGWVDPSSWAWAPYDEATQSSVDWTQLPTLRQREKGIELGSLFPYSDNLDVYHCPSDRAQKDEFKLRSYSIPDSLNGKHTTIWQVLTKFSQIKNPSTKYVFVEEDDGRYYNMNSWVLAADASQPDGISRTIWNDPYLTVWHNESSNIGYLDGHVDIYKWGNETRQLLSQESKDIFGVSGTWGGSWGPGNIYNCNPSTPGGQEDLEMMVRGWPK